MSFNSRHDEISLDTILTLVISDYVPSLDTSTGVQMEIQMEVTPTHQPSLTEAPNFQHAPKTRIPTKIWKMSPSLSMPKRKQQIITNIFHEDLQNDSEPPR